MDSCEEVSSGFFVAGCDGSELFESIEETLDEVAFGVEGEVGRGRSRADPFRKTMAVATCTGRGDFSRADAARGSLTGYYSSLAEICRSVSNSASWLLLQLHRCRRRGRRSKRHYELANQTGDHRTWGR